MKNLEEEDYKGEIPENKVGYPTEERKKFTDNPYEYQLSVLNDKWFDALLEYKNANIAFDAEDRAFERVKLLLKDIIPDTIKLRELCVVQIAKEKEKEDEGNRNKPKKAKGKQSITSPEDFVNK